MTASLSPWSLALSVGAIPLGDAPLDLSPTGLDGTRLVVVGLLVAAVLAVTWKLRRARAPHGSSFLPLGSCALGARRHATLLRVGSRIVLVGVADGSVRPLGEWDASVLDEALSEGPAGDGPPVDERPAGAFGREESVGRTEERASAV